MIKQFKLFHNPNTIEAHGDANRTQNVQKKIINKYTRLLTTTLESLLHFIRPFPLVFARTAKIENKIIYFIG